MKGQLVSCVCVTKNNLALLNRSLQCFANQTYKNRELIVVYESNNADLKTELKKRTYSSNIIFMEVDHGRKMSLGELRNFSIEQCKGEFICQWDDDDWYHEERIERQQEVLLKSGKSACILNYWIMYDELTGNAYLSYPWYWPGTIMFRKKLFDEEHKYPSLSREEDTAFIRKLVQGNDLASFTCPLLYVYVIHGKNTWQRAHFENLFKLSQKLSTQFEGKLNDVLYSKTGSSFTYEEFDEFRNLTN